MNTNIDYSGLKSEDAKQKLKKMLIDAFEETTTFRRVVSVLYICDNPVLESMKCKASLNKFDYAKSLNVFVGYLCERINIINALDTNKEALESELENCRKYSQSNLEDIKELIEKITENIIYIFTIQNTKIRFHDL